MQIKNRILATYKKPTSPWLDANLNNNNISCINISSTAIPESYTVSHGPKLVNYSAPNYYHFVVF